MQYNDFLSQKIKGKIDNGFTINPDDINPLLYNFQRAIVQWAIRKGRAAIFADCGLGKTPIQLEWAEQIYNKINQNVIIFAPLAVNQQTVEEGEKFNIHVNICREQSDVKPGINIANYEIMHKFDCEKFGGIILDESSILKSYGGQYRKDLTIFARDIKYKLCCTATPAPNDLIELINHAEFLDVMRGKEMIALYFTQDGNTTHKWRLKKHAQKDFWKWISTWSVALRKPEDLGYNQDGFNLPDLNIVKCITESEAAQGHLFAIEATGLKEQRLVQKASLTNRLEKTIQIINDSEDQWLKERKTSIDVKVESSCQNIVDLNKEYVLNLQHEDKKTIQSRILSEEQRGREKEKIGILPCSQRRNGQGKKNKLFERILSKEQSKTEKKDTGTEESTQRESSKEICNKSGISKEVNREGQNISNKQSAYKKGTEFKEIRNDLEGIESDAGSSRQQMCDMRNEGKWQQKDISLCRSRSQNKQSERSTVYQLQSSNREIQGQSSNIDECNQLPQWLIWCNYNYESDALKKNILGSVEIKGADPISHKEKAMIDFKHSKIKVLVTKASVAGFGMNFQQCHNIIFVGLSHSYEQYYQALRRCWRYGQKSPVNIYIVISESERSILNNVLEKEKNVSGMMDNIIKQMGGLQMDGTKRQEMKYEEQEINNGDYRMILGDAIEKMDEIESNSIGLSIFSPPFPGMYAYTNSMRDVGNCTKIDEMIDHFRYLVKKDKLYRVLKPGRMAAIHLCQLTAMLSRDGYIGLKDYRGRVIQMMIDEGWVYAGEVTIDKNPQLQAVRNKERGLLFKTLANDASKLRMGLGDYLIYFRKPGESLEPIRAGISKKYNPDGSGWITESEWIEWAAPVWYRQSKDYPGGIRETDVLNVRAARSEDDERHLCPLQLGVIHRAVYLWSNPGDIVLSPFAGLGSEGYQALLDHRRFVGIELKKEYYEVALNNLQYALHKRQDDNLQLFENLS